MPRQQEPRLSHSQNFLRDPRLVDALLAHSSIQAGDLVYEIGPGTGVITERLARRCRRVVAIEKDRRLAAFLGARFGSTPNVTIREADFLDVQLPELPFKVFASIPYAQTAAIVTRLTAEQGAPEDSYLVVQREAAARFAGAPRATLVAALLYPWFTAAIAHRFRRTDFRPVPRVESVLLHLHQRKRPLVSCLDTPFFRDFVTLAFTAPRPTLHDTLRAGVGRPLADSLLQAAGLDRAAIPSMVPGTLWVLLFEHLKDAGGAWARQRVEGAEQQLRHRQEGLQKRHRTQVGPARARSDRPPPRARRMATAPLLALYEDVIAHQDVRARSTRQC